jgi:hypothetical protein
MSTTAPAGSVEAPTGRFRLASPRTASVLGVLAAVLLVAFPVLLVLTHQFGQFGPPFAIAAPSAAVGFLIARRQPGNPIGWLLLVSITLGAFSIDSGYYAWLVYGLGHGGLPLGWLAALVGQFGILAFVGFPLVILLFPQGRLPSQGWRWVVVGYLSIGAVDMAGLSVLGITALVEHRLNAQTVSARGGNWLINQPTSTAWLSWGAPAFLVAIVLFLVASVVHQVRSYRRSTGVLRQQLKSLMGGGVVCVLAVVALAAGAAGSIPWIAFSALPISISVAILKYRLYEIDRLISRTLSYLIVTGMLVSVFLGLVILTTRVLPFSSPVGVAASTLAAAALFNPLRLRVQRLVDRRFNRARYDAEVTVTAFRLRLRAAIDLDTVQRELLRTVDRAVEPAHTSLWIRPSGTGSRR